jgi:hydroxyacylglutathione hydrolase
VIVHTLLVGPLQTNCYLVVCPETQAGVVIDPGGDADDIAAIVEQQRVRLVYILLTHAHFDHMGAAAQLVKMSGAPLAAHPAEGALLKLGGGGLLFGFFVPPAPPPDVHLAEGQILEVGTLRLHVLHTPGHTPGHVAFHEPAQQVVFDGDVLFAGGIGRTDLPGGNTKQLMDSIHTKLLVLPDETTVYSGHGPVTTIGRERRYNPFL